MTYAKLVCKLKPKKAKEVHRTRLTVGGNKVHYPGNVGTPTADLTAQQLSLFWWEKNSYFLVGAYKIST